MQNDLISRSALLKEAAADGAYGYVDATQIADAPAVDAVEVVHCKDCGERNEFGRCNCITGRNIYVPVGDDFFCGYGERRAEDD